MQDEDESYLREGSFVSGSKEGVVDEEGRAKEERKAEATRRRTGIVGDGEEVEGGTRVEEEKKRR